MKKNFVFIVPGKAFALGSLHASSYGDQIRQVAGQHIAEPLAGSIDLRLEYLFSESKNRLDGDNLLKMYCDSLEGVAYLNDKQIHHHEVSLHKINSSYMIRGVPLTEEAIDCFTKEAFTIVKLKVI